MKKLIMTIAIVLGMGMSTFAQEVEVYEEKGLFGMGKGIFRGGNGEKIPCSICLDLVKRKTLTQHLWAAASPSSWALAQPTSWANAVRRIDGWPLGNC